MNTIVDGNSAFLGMNEHNLVDTHENNNTARC